jgi:hypothetical protein
LPLVNEGGAFPYTGLDDGIYTDGNAAALVGRSVDAVFLAFRGTNDMPSGMLGLTDVAAALAGAGTPDVDQWFDNPVLNGGLPTFNDQGMRDHYGLLAPLVSALDTYINNPANGVNKVFVTGHSLGAAMTQAYMDTHAGDYRFEAVTFADPGSKVWH